MRTGWVNPMQHQYGNGLSESGGTPGLTCAPASMGTGLSESEYTPARPGDGRLAALVTVVSPLLTRSNSPGDSIDTFFAARTRRPDTPVIAAASSVARGPRSTCLSAWGKFAPSGLT